MANTSFTRDSVESLTELGDHRDEKIPGFYIRVRLSKRTGTLTRTYLVNGKVAQTRNNITVIIGTSTEFTPKQAAAQALEYKAAMAKGTNPNGVKQVQRDMAATEAAGRKAARSKEEITLKVLLDEYLATHKAKLSPKTVKDYRQFLVRCVPKWLNTPINKITSAMVLDKQKELSVSPAQANYCMRILRALFNFAAHQYAELELIKINPTKIISQARVWNPEKRRQTLITEADFPAWFQAVQDLESTDARDYLMLVVFTGLRKSEAEGLLWKNVALDARTIKVEDTKNGTDFTLPMTATLYKLLKGREAVSKTSNFVFPGQGVTGHMVDIRDPIDVVREATNSSFTIHDLRRTFETIAESLDISHYTLKRLLNHSTGADVTAGYIVTSPERLRAAMELVEKRILELAKGKSKKKARHLQAV